MKISRPWWRGQRVRVLWGGRTVLARFIRIPGGHTGLQGLALVEIPADQNGTRLAAKVAIPMDDLAWKPR